MIYSSFNKLAIRFLRKQQNILVGFILFYFFALLILLLFCVFVSCYNFVGNRQILKKKANPNLLSVCT